MDVGRFLALLQTSELYFARRCEVDDLWEGFLPTTLVEGLSYRPVADGSGARASIVAHVDRATDQVVFSCWHENEQESVAMWSLYTTGREGIAIQTTAGRLKAHLMAADVPVVRIGRVQYLDHSRDSTPFSDPSNGVSLLCKRQSYAHEREVRAMFVHDSQTGRGVGIQVDLPKLIDKIVVSPGYPNWAVPALQDAVNRAGIMLKIDFSDLIRQPNRGILADCGGIPNE